MTTSRYADLSRDELAVLVPELLLIGQLIDRSGMAWCISAFGREGMGQVAIEEWMAASPIYTGRMQRALGYEGTDVITIFKGLQLDIGAPPQFMDFRYAVHDRWHGEFHLDHCGALMDVEPMGAEYVRTMCHDIEDPTFDATAVATNAKAQVRPVHRPPRLPADRSPHCAWTVIIDESHPPVSESADCTALRSSRAALTELAPIVPDGEGRSDYSGDLLADLDFAEFSHAALVRIADEVCLQMHLLNLGFLRAIDRRTEADQYREIATKQLVGIAGVAAGRIRAALGLPADEAGALRVLALHPLLNPAAYVAATIGDAVTVSHGPAHHDGAWITLVGPDAVAPLQAAVRAVDPHLDVEVTGSEQAWTAHVLRREEAAAEAGEVAVTRFSTGASFAFEHRKAIPITVL
ncbi:hypothetical protein EFK50_18790 [Nocardioides marmoriginsengisoli]|uniref:Uncharacterized protein n=1 Tax=Nocardioides marmoriginsengisoli TaxID=661483 RepID=A0A3N0CAA5_9ACTN|nr:hypothetical protein [Nocardioides marmoriginsengisoli]RNL60390.1 hypothetical protein EFK50_18790 [Nocardioides marmoriginsengisoli]